MKITMSGRCVPDQSVPKKTLGRSFPWMMRPGMQRPLDTASLVRWVHDLCVSAHGRITGGGLLSQQLVAETSLGALRATAWGNPSCAHLTQQMDRIH